MCLVRIGYMLFYDLIVQLHHAAFVGGNIFKSQGLLLSRFIEKSHTIAEYDGQYR